MIVSSRIRNSQMRFINLHTHRKPQIEGEWCIRNGYTGSKYQLNALNYALSLGIHPWLIEGDGSAQMEILKRNFNNNRVVALGECGLDRVKGPDLELQKHLFQQQIDLANAAGKPLILHMVRTYSDLLEFSASIQVPFIVHGFKGNITEAWSLLKKGACLSFGYRLFDNPGLQEVFQLIPLERIYLETDVKPLRIDWMYAKAAQVLGITPEKLCVCINSNAKRDFGF